MPRSKIESSYTSTLPKGFRGLLKVETYLYNQGGGTNIMLDITI